MILGAAFVLVGVYCVWTFLANPSTIPALESARRGRYPVGPLLVGICLILFGGLILWPEKKFRISGNEEQTSKIRLLTNFKFERNHNYAKAIGLVLSIILVPFLVPIVEHIKNQYQILVYSQLVSKMELVCYPLGTGGSMGDKKDCYRVDSEGKAHDLEKSNWLVWKRQDLIDTENPLIYPINGNYWKVGSTCRKKSAGEGKNQFNLFIVSKFAKSESDCPSLAAQLLKDFEKDEFLCAGSNGVEKTTCLKFSLEVAKSDSYLQQYYNNLVYKDADDQFTIVTYISHETLSCETHKTHFENNGARSLKCYKAIKSIN